MIESVEKLKKQRPDLVEEFEKMTREELLEQCYKESLDAINMEKRVSVFMSECTISMSKSNYTLDSLRRMISDKQEYDIQEFCSMLVEDSEDDSEIVKEIREKADEFDNQ
jgi:hypothetical protein